MRSDKLQDAIGLVDSDLVDRAEKGQKKNFKKFHIKWIVPVAAALVIVIVAGVFFGNGIRIPSSNYTPVNLNKYAISKAQYPAMAKYPGEIFGGISDAYDKWFEDRRARREYFGAGENLDGFFEDTISEFLADSGDENAVYSPLNVYMALAMLAETTDGNSRQQILDLLDAEDMESLRTQAHAIWNANYSDDGLTTSKLASSLWLDEKLGTAYNSDTLETLSDSYYASVYQGKMGSKEYNNALKTWLNEQTGDLLKEYVSDVEMSPENILTMATTVYFKDQWSSEFLESETGKDVFHSPAGDVNCDFMHQTITGTAYCWGDKFSSTSKHFEGGASMWFVLPDEGVSVEELLTDDEVLSFITASKEDWGNSEYIKVNLSVPKFDVSSNINLSQGLKSLGVTDCFNQAESDFSPLIVGEGVFLSDVSHSARVKIDEEGVEAAAMTIMKYGAGAPPEDEVDFVLDRPFIFVITNADGLPMFVGVVNNP